MKLTRHRYDLALHAAHAHIHSQVSHTSPKGFRMILCLVGGSVYDNSFRGSFIEYHINSTSYLVLVKDIMLLF